MHMFLATGSPAPPSSSPSPGGNSSIATWVLFALIGFFLYSMFFSNRGGLKKGIQAPSLGLQGLTAQTQTAPAFAGKVTVLYFWASWCGICKQDLASSSRFARKMEKEGVRYLLINTDRGVNAPSLARFLARFRVAKQDLKYHYFEPKPRSIRRYKIRAFPTTIILNRKGKVSGVYRGRLPKSALATAIKRI